MRPIGLLLVIMTLATACSAENPERTTASVNPEADPPAAAESSLVLPEPEPDALEMAFPTQLRLGHREVGDLDQLVDNGAIYVLVTYSATHYFLDGARQRGLAYESLKEFEKFLNQKLNRRTLRVDVVIIPVSRDALLPALAEGLGDMAVANLTITDRRRELVDFSRPFTSDVSEMAVTGPSGPELKTLDDLAGQTIHVRRSSSYFESLTQLSDELVGRGLPAIDIMPVAEHLEDEDLLEMVNAGLIQLIVVDNHKALFWKQILENIVVHVNITLRSGGEIAWAIRKDCPQLKEMVDGFAKKNRVGSLFANVLLKRYLESTKWVDNALSSHHNDRLDELMPYFEKYGEEYGFEPLLLAGQGFQESGLQQSEKSSAGAIGIMQIKPTTAADRNVGIPDISTPDANIHAGTKYLAFIRDRYFTDPTIDSTNRVLFSLAAYNAGPARVRRLRNEAEASGLDPNMWFRNVEVIAARRIGRETVRYVSNITKYFIAYRLSREQIAARQQATDELKSE